MSHRPTEQPLDTARQATLAAALRTALPTEAVLTDAESRRVFECDGISVFTEMPMLVVMPETTEQVQQIMRICHEHETIVVARGAGTGLSAGALPHNAGVLLVLSKLSEILEINPEARLARVQPGVRNLAISEAVAEHGLFYAPDPSSQIACSIGGNIAENSGGVHCLKYGLTVHNILSVELITVEGERVTLGSQGLDASGPDLLALIIGSEGLLGVVTEITVKLIPLPTETRLMTAGFATVREAGEAVGAVIAAGIIPAGLEMMDGPAIDAAENFVHAGYPMDAEALLLCELDGTPEEVEELIQRVETIFNEYNATSQRIAETEEERLLIWKGRKSAFPAVAMLAPEYYCMDGTVPRGKIADVLDEIQLLSKQYGLQVANVFHAGDGNLHPLIVFDLSVPGELEKTEAFGGDILKACVRAGGSITGEHGVGVEKIQYMTAQYDDATLAAFNAIKAAFDPNETLNPGKGVPQLRHCQEYRAASPLITPNSAPSEQLREIQGCGHVHHPAEHHHD